LIHRTIHAGKEETSVDENRRLLDGNVGQHALCTPPLARNPHLGNDVATSATIAPQPAALTHKQVLVIYSGLVLAMLLGAVVTTV
jgi:hypothetical protein